MVNDPNDRWVWRNCRTVTFGAYVQLFPWQWHVRAKRCSDLEHWKCTAQFLPFIVHIHCDIGNNSTGDWRAWFGLSECEAYARACRAVRRK